MEEYYKLDYEKVFNYILRLKRWYNNFSNDWVFVRDIVYLNWYIELENFIWNWGDLKELYIWKIDIKDLETLKDSYIIKLDFSDIMVPFFL